MSKKPVPKPDDPEQYKRFVETAKEVEADEGSEALKKALKQLAPLPKDARSGGS